MEPYGALLELSNRLVEPKRRGTVTSSVGTVTPSSGQRERFELTGAKMVRGPWLGGAWGDQTQVRIAR
jgi:hypothetical protein